MTAQDWIDERKRLVHEDQDATYECHLDEGVALTLKRRQVAGVLALINISTLDDQLEVESAERLADGANSLPAALAALGDVLRMHQPLVTGVLTGYCAVGECDHDGEDKCPLISFVYCAACHEIAKMANEYYAEDGMQIVAFPCQTVRAITAALGCEP